MTDTRQHPRTAIPKYFPGGTFHLIAGDRRYHYVRANDISQSGIGLDIPSSLPAGTSVRLRYISTNWRTDLDGEVVWCGAGELVGEGDAAYQNYRVGLSFASDNAASSALLYLALKEYTSLSSAHKML